MMRCFSTCFKRCKKKEIPDVYVLLLEGGKYYVGESMDVDKRISAHKKGRGSTWTKNNEVISVLQPITKKQESFWELKETLERFKLHGIENVRGSMFTSPYGLTRNDKYIAGQLYCELNNLCRKCGSPDHFIGNCKSTEVADWVHNFGGTLDLKGEDDFGRKCSNCSKDISELPKYFRFCRECYSGRP
tara:strand:+ start:89 stop:652 length:564 start_codon:yes stop_codon:yes gene_type:complete